MNKKIKVNQLILCIFIYTILSLPIILMYVINFLKLETINVFGITIQRFYYSTRQNDMLIFSNEILKQLITNMTHLCELLLVQNDRIPWNSVPGFGTIYVISNIFIIWGMVKIIKKDTNKPIIACLWLFLSLVIGILINNVNINRLNIIWYPLILLTAYGVYNFYNNVKYKDIAKYVIIGIYIISFLLFYQQYYNIYRFKIADSFTFSNGLVEACEFIKNNCKNNIIVSESANVSGTYVYYKYAINKEPADRSEHIYYYTNKSKEMSWFNTKDLMFETFIVNKNEVLNAPIYLIRVEEKEKILNLEEYEQTSFRSYIVLIRKQI